MSRSVGANLVFAHPNHQPQITQTGGKMDFPPPAKQRKSIRLKNYDYSNTGAYFITICIQHKHCLLGEVRDGAMQLNTAGRMVADHWLKIPSRFPQVILDEFVIMPNHIHGVIALPDKEDTVPGSSDVANYAPLGRILQAFKSITTREYTAGVKARSWPSFPGKLWQRNYWDRVIRSETELSLIREYIRNNPLQWALDKLYVAVEPEL
ncbi:transposase [Microbulbifer sp. SAOS-129_SWC]|uniref:transposase n=1 Tax=Microbulbifer sp. SAOS-129_SWC TaxID=3145235 RepID=UPI003216227D